MTVLLLHFTVILVGLFRALALPMIRSQMSKLAFPSEQGIILMFILMLKLNFKTATMHLLQVHEWYYIKFYSRKCYISPNIVGINKHLVSNSVEINFEV